jgi:hypothetical protein
MQFGPIMMSRIGPDCMIGPIRVGSGPIVGCTCATREHKITRDRG